MTTEAIDFAREYFEARGRFGPSREWSDKLHNDAFIAAIGTADEWWLREMKKLHPNEPWDWAFREAIARSIEATGTVAEPLRVFAAAYVRGFKPSKGAGGRPKSKGPFHDVSVLATIYAVQREHPTLPMLRHSDDYKTADRALSVCAVVATAIKQSEAAIVKIWKAHRQLIGSAPPMPEPVDPNPKA